MTRTASSALIIAVLVVGAVGAGAPPQGIEKLRQQFRDPPGDSRPMMRWWWFGPAVTRAGIERELRVMRDGGIGGVEVQPVYPLSLDDEARGIRNLPYLSPGFLEALRAAAETARDLGLRFDLTLGSGWPYGGPQVPAHEAAARMRVDRVPIAPGSRRVGLPTLAAGESMVAAFGRDGAGRTRELPLGETPDGVLWFDGGAPPPAEVWFFVATRTGQMVKRAAVGAEGFVVDHLDRAAVDHYLERVGSPLLDAIGSHAPQAIFCDSLEAYGNDWTGDFLDQFRARRGYDLKPHLPALVDEKHPESPAVRHDWAETLSELVEERFFAPLGAWARAHGTRLRIQGYGSPPAALSANRHADLIDGEGSHWKQLTASRWAASASHAFDRAVVASETWTWLHSPVFRATPLDVKAEADRHFLQGINQLIGHGWPYTADGIEYPGWRFYAAGVFNEKNPWWLVMPDMSRYFQRVSFLLRQGRPVVDVAIYLPTHDAFSRLAPGQVNLLPALADRVGQTVPAQLLDAGFGVGLVDDAILQSSRMEAGALAAGVARYKVLVLPGIEQMPLDTLRHVEALAREGVLVIATRQAPRLVPGLRASDADHGALREMAARLFTAPGARGHLIADETTVGATLAQLTTPDVVMTPAVPDVGFVHRSSGDAELYFVANTGPVRQKTSATFRVAGLDAEWWNPLTGDVTLALAASQTPSSVTMAVELEPYGSRVLVFANGAQRPRRLSRPESTKTTLALDLSADWTVAFSGQPSPVTMAALRSWTDDERTRYFSGVATYERRFTVPSWDRRRPSRLVLDFGEGARSDEPQPQRNMPGMTVPFDGPVREAAVVEINGQRAGSVWCPPYQVDVSALVRPGANTLRIQVGNLAVNQMAGRPLPDYRLLNLRYGERFQPQDMDRIRPVPAGLLGPVRLLRVDEAAR